VGYWGWELASYNSLAKAFLFGFDDFAYPLKDLDPGDVGFDEGEYQKK